MTDATSVAADQLKSIVERIERLEEDKRAIADDIKEVYGEAKGSGFDVAILRKIIALRKKPADERAEEDAILELYPRRSACRADGGCPEHWAGPAWNSPRRGCRSGFSRRRRCDRIAGCPESRRRGGSA